MAFIIGAEGLQDGVAETQGGEVTCPRQPSRFQDGPGEEPGVLTPVACVPCGPGRLESKKLNHLRVVRQLLFSQ